MRKVILIVAVVGIHSSYVHAQEVIKKIWDGIEIRKGFESLDDNKDPAMLSLTFPKEGKDSYLISGGIALSLKIINHDLKKFPDKSLKVSLSPFFVANKNTMIDEEQDNRKAGINGTFKLGSISLADGRNKFVSWSTTFEYARNFNDTTHSLVWTNYFSWTRSKVDKVKNEESGFYLNVYRHFGKGFLYYVGFSTGPEFQRRMRAPETADEGNIFRIFYNTELRLLKKTGTDADGDPIAELVFSNVGRYDLSNSTDVTEGYLPLVCAEVLFYPGLSHNFSLGFSYNTGSDPIAGLADQTYYLLAMKFKK